MIPVGRGMKNGENFKLLYDLADKLNAAGTVHTIYRATAPFTARIGNRLAQKAGNYFLRCVMVYCTMVHQEYQKCSLLWYVCSLFIKNIKMGFYCMCSWCIESGGGCWVCTQRHADRADWEDCRSSELVTVCVCLYVLHSHLVT